MPPVLTFSSSWLLALFPKLKSSSQIEDAPDLIWKKEAPTTPPYYSPIDPVKISLKPSPLAVSIIMIFLHNKTALFFNWIIVQSVYLDSKEDFFSYSHKIITLILRSAPAVAVSASLHLVARSNVFQLVHKYFPHQPRGLAAGSTSLQELAKQNITIERDFLRGGNHRSQLFSSLLHSLAQASSSTTS